MDAELILGARRLLEQLPAECTPNRAALYKAQEICARLRCADIAAAAVVFSGDTGFYSGASALCRALDAAGLPYTVEPGYPACSFLAAALHRPGRTGSWSALTAAAVTSSGLPHRKARLFFLTGGSETPATLCRALADAGWGRVKATVGENLGSTAERLVTDTVETLANLEFAPLSVLLVEPLPAAARRVPGWPDEAFLRGKTPMTKQEVRAAVLAKLAVRPGDTLWDIGAGTGSVSVEMALAAPVGRVCAVECDPEACALIRQNRAKFAVANLYLTEGPCPRRTDGAARARCRFHRRQ